MFPSAHWPRRCFRRHTGLKKSLHNSEFTFNSHCQVKNLKAKSGLQRGALLAQEKSVAEFEKELHTKTKTEDLLRRNIEEKDGIIISTDVSNK